MVYPDLPQERAIHFDSAGEPDDYVTKPIGTALLPVLALLVTGLFAVSPRLDPLGENFGEFERYYDLAAVVTVAILGYVQALVFGYNLGYELVIQQALAALIPTVCSYVFYRRVEAA
jgi:uncharacterized membrane protein